MTITAVAQMGANNATLSGTSLVITCAAAGALVGDLVLLVIGKDNTQTTDGITNEVTAVVDSASNTWTKIGEYCNGQGTAAAGQVVSLWMSILTVAIPITTGTSTLTMDTTAIKQAVADNYRLSENFTWFLESVRRYKADDAADPSTMFISGLSAEQHLYIRAHARESGGSSQTPTASWTEAIDSVAGGNSPIYMEHLISSAATATSDPAGSNADHASIMVAFTPKYSPGLFAGMPL